MDVTHGPISTDEKDIKDFSSKEEGNTNESDSGKILHKKIIKHTSKSSG